MGIRTPPFIQQLQAEECGPACLAMVAGAWGFHVALTEVRDLCGFGRSGVNAYDMKLAAEAIGFQAGVFRVEPDQLPALLKDGPVILHWDMNHYVVAYKADKRGMWIQDPTSGARKIPIEEINVRFTGVVIVLTPGEGFKVQAKAPDPFKDYLFGALGGRSDYLSLALKSVAAQAAILMPALLTRVIVDVVPGREFKVLLVVILVFSSTALVSVWARWAQASAMAALAFRGDVRLMNRILSRMISLPVSWCQARGSAELALRLGLIAGSTRVVADALVTLISSGSLLVVVCLSACFMSPFLGTVALLQAIFIAILSIRLGNWLVGMMSAFSRTWGAVGCWTAEMAGAMEWIHGAGLKEWALRKSDPILQSFQTWAESLAKEESRIGLVLSISRAAIDAVIFMTTIRMAISGWISIGTAGALVVLQGIARTAAESFAQALRTLVRQRPLLDRVRDVLETDAEEHGDFVGTAKGHLVLDGVTFKYWSSAPSVLEGCRLEIGPGEFVALVGPSGSGKSTLGALMAGLLKPSDGSVLLDGVPISQWSESSLRKQVAVVLQTPEIFEGTVRWNLALGSEIDDQKLWWVLEGVGLAARVKALGGLEGRISSQGANLSGGEMQRLALARAIVSCPKVLVLDEATSALDLEMEAKIHTFLDSLRMTRVLITHRKGSLKMVDRILEVRDGAVHGH